MEDEKFREGLRNARLMKSKDPDFSIYNYVNFDELTGVQRLQVEKEFGKRKKWIENPIFYDYYEHDEF